MLKIVKLVLLVPVTALIIIGLFLIYMIITDYKPKDIEEGVIFKNESSADMIKAGETVKITTFNIGYAGLDKYQDFFMDGGKNSKSSSKEKTKENLNAIIDFLAEEDSDIYALQEVDLKSTRSFDINEAEYIIEGIQRPHSSFGSNYKVKWVPVPLTDPMGYTDSGIMTMSRFQSISDIRYQLPGKESFPRRYFMLDRCIVETQIPVDNGKTLYFINLHLSAFDKGGRIRAEQVKYLIDYIKEKKNEDNYMILAGDWNHLLSKSFIESFEGELPGWVVLLPDELFELDFKLVVDESINTIRSTSTPYVKGESFETVIDGFFISNDIEIVKVYGHDLGFENTDHQPVTVEVKLN